MIKCDIVSQNRKENSSDIQIRAGMVDNNVLIGGGFLVVTNIPQKCTITLAEVLAETGMWKLLVLLKLFYNVKVV